MYALSAIEVYEMSKTVADRILDRKSKLAEILCAVSSLENFDRQDITSLCKESKTRFVTNVLKQLTADSVIGLVSAEEDSEPRYGWLMDPRQFDADRWIHDQLLVGTQVQSAPREERPRERLLDHGVKHLKTSELLAILIRSGRKGESAVQSGQRVAAHFEDCLEKLPDGSAAELRDISSAVSQVAYCQIMAGVELGDESQKRPHTAGRLRRSTALKLPWTTASNTLHDLPRTPAKKSSTSSLWIQNCSRSKVIKSRLARLTPAWSILERSFEPPSATQPRQSCWFTTILPAIQRPAARTVKSPSD